jgi:hypothetical protein
VEISAEMESTLAGMARRMCASQVPFTRNCMVVLPARAIMWSQQDQKFSFQPIDSISALPVHVSSRLKK